MATLSVNQVYKKYVSHTDTPFHIWLNAEKKNYMERKGLTMEDIKSNPDAFDRFVNLRYRAGGENVWQNYVSKIMNESDKNIEANLQDVQIIETDAVKGKSAEKTSETVIDNASLPFYKRRYLNMPFPVAAGLTTILTTSIILAGVATYKHFKKK